MVKFVEWSDVLSVGIEEIDDQHKVLVGLVNEHFVLIVNLFNSHTEDIRPLDEFHHQSLRH